ncbi:MAG: hypothetical protein ABI273_13050 [Lacunisphaera sp.]
MRNVLILLMLLLAAGCATPRPVVVRAAPSVIIAAASSTKFVETRYDVESYRDAANPSLRHEAHAVYRRTRVPLTATDELETVNRTSYPPASIAPLPLSEELNAELATQRQVTTELRAMQTAMAETDQKMQTQYALLVRQSADVQKLRGQLEAERNRVPRESQVETTAGATAPAPSSGSDVKW